MTDFTTHDLDTAPTAAKPFLEDVAKRGLPWHVIDVPAGAQDDLFAVET